MGDADYDFFEYNGVRYQAEAYLSGDLHTPGIAEWAALPGKDNPRPPKLDALKGPDLAEFYAYINQDKYWIMYSAPLNQLVSVQISDMPREHAKNAAKWLVRERKMLKRRMMVAIGVDHTGYPELVKSKDLIKGTPLYMALRNRVATPPNQAFSRKELEYMFSYFAPEGDFGEKPDLEATIRGKSSYYLDGDL